MEAEKIIFSYIRSRGLKSTEQALRADVKNQTKFDLSQTPRLERCESAYISLLELQSDEFLEDSFYDSYLLYRDWADSSLDSYKSDLKKFASPLFTYMYLYTIQKNKIEKARLFFNAFSSSLSAYDLSKLSTAQSQNDLNSEFVKKTYFHKSEEAYTKILISICKSSLLLLMSFIEENRLYCLLMIINTHIEVYLCLETSEDYPVLLSDLESYKNKSFLSLNVVMDEDKRREIKVPLPTQSLDYINQRSVLLEEKADLTDSLPYVICHNIRSGCSKSTNCTSVDISEDGSVIVAGFEDSCIRKWVLNYGSDYISLIGHSTSILSLSICPDKSSMISSSDDSEIRLWSFITDSCIAVYSFHYTPVWCVKFSPTGHYFASGGLEGAACIWSIEYTTPLKILCGHIQDVLCLDFHPRATFLATGGADKTVRIWDSSSGDCVRVFCGHKSPISAVYFSKSGKNLYSGDDDGTVQCWDINEKESLWVLYASSSITHISTSQENSIVACSLQNGSVLLITSCGKLKKTCRTKALSLYICSFTLKNILAVCGSFK